MTATNFSAEGSRVMRATQKVNYGWTHHDEDDDDYDDFDDDGDDEDDGDYDDFDDDGDDNDNDNESNTKS